MHPKTRQLGRRLRSDHFRPQLPASISAFKGLPDRCVNCGSVGRHKYVQPGINGRSQIEPYGLSGVNETLPDLAGWLVDGETGKVSTRL